MLSPGSAGYVFGSGFGTAVNTTVTLGGIKARILSVSNNQIRARFPRNLPAGLATLIVTVEGRVSQAVNVIVSTGTPGQADIGSSSVVPGPPVAYSPPHRVLVANTTTSDSSPVIGTTNASGLVYTCDSTVTAASSTACTTLNTTIAGLYSSAFTNANANIYITLGDTGLGESLFPITSVSYSSFRSALVAAESDANDALAVTSSVPVTNPYGSDSVEMTGALARALGFPFSSGIRSNETSCTLGTTGCYNGIITVANNQPLYFRQGTIVGSQYDFFTVVEHETDEILGTASCAFANGRSPCTSSTIYPADLFRYHSDGTRSYAPGTNNPCSTGDSTNACFSLDGKNMLQQYNNQNTDEDAGDWSYGCNNILVQNAVLCSGVAGVDISPSAEILVLDVVGFTATSSGPAAVTNVTSSTVNGTYGVGAGVSIQIVFDQTVSVTGTPQLALNSGGTASYNSGSGTHTLTFLYPVAAGQNSARLDYASSAALTLNGGAIDGSDGIAASLTLATPGAVGSLSASSDIVINTSTANITIQTNPEALQFTVDGGSAQTAPQTLTLSQGQHTIAVATTQSGGTGIEDVFANWSDGGAASHTITVGAAATFTATFTTEYQLTIGALPSSAGTVTPSSGTFYIANTSVPINATANAGYAFSGWSGPVANPNSAATTVTMIAPENIAANFLPPVNITIQTAPSGLQFSVDGGALQTASRTLSLSQGPHTISVVTTQAGPAGSQFVFTGWSDGGAASHTITVGSSPATYTATFKTQYQLIIGASPGAGGTVTPASGAFYDAGSVVQVTATANAGYAFNGWSGTVASASSATTTVTMTAAETITANFLPLTGITIQTTPTGLQFSVDGGPAQTAPQTLNLSQGTHSVSVVTAQAGPAGSQFVFTGWSDGGAASHTITVGSSPATYTATFQTQYQLTIGVSPAAGGTVTPSSGSFYNGNTVVAINATAAAGYAFNNWSGSVANANTASTTVTMNAPLTVTANFTPLTGITIQTSPEGLQFSVDGTAAQTAPATLNLTQGTHTIAVAAVEAGISGTQYAFASWSDGGAASHTITVGSSAATYTAAFTVQYLLTTAVSPAGTGSVTASPSSNSGYYNAGSSVQLTGTPGAGYQFISWAGDLSGSTNPQSITMNAPHRVTANFSTVAVPCSLTLSATSASLPATGTSTVETCPNNSSQPSCGVAPEVPVSFTVTPSAACGPWAATSSDPGFLQIVSGGTPSGPATGAGTVTFAQLTNTHNGQQSNTIMVTSGATSASYTVTEAGSGDSQTYREVYALYEQLLGRDPDSGGVAFWTGVGAAGLGQMADSFLTSPEAFESDFAVMAAYQAATGTPPTYAQYTAAVASIRAGAQTVPGLFTSLTGSGYTATNLYQNLLSRTPAAGDSSCIGTGLAACFQSIIGYPSSTTPVGGGNNEFQSTGSYHTTLAADHTNGLYVQMIYYVTVSRDPDPSGLAFWVGVANSGGPGLLFQGSGGYPTRIQILGPGTPDQGFIGSPEFQGLFAN